MSMPVERPKNELEGELKEIPPVIEVPVGFLKAGPFVIRPPYEKDDPVVVVFSEKAIDKLLVSGKPENPKYKRRHSIDDAIVVNSLQTENNVDLNSDYTEDLLLENQDTGSRIVLIKNGDMEINVSGNQTENTDGDKTETIGGAETKEVISMYQAYLTQEDLIESNLEQH